MDLKKLVHVPPWEWPNDAGSKFLAALRDRSAPTADRLVAAELAGDLVVMNDALAHALLAVLREAGEPEELRSAAAVALGAVLEQAHMEQFGDPDEVPISQKTFHDICDTMRKLFFDAGTPGDVRRMLLEGSARAPQDWHKDTVRAAYASGDPAWRLTAVFCMRFVGGFEKQILEALESGDEALEFQALSAAGVWEVDDAWPYVRAVLGAEKPDKEMLLAAIEAAASIRPDEAFELLEDYLDSDDADIAEAAQDALIFTNREFDHEDFDD